MLLAGIAGVVAIIEVTQVDVVKDDTTIQGDGGKVTWKPRGDPTLNRDSSSASTASRPDRTMKEFTVKVLDGPLDRATS